MIWFAVNAICAPLIRARGAGRRRSFALAYGFAARRFYETRGGSVKKIVSVKSSY